MPTFPQLTGAVISGLPFGSEQAFHTVSAESPGGQRYSYAQWASPLWAWDLEYSALTATQADELLAFFDARKGRFESFDFVDPSGNLFVYSEDFTQASWIKSGLSVGGLVTDPFGGVLARSITGSGTLSSSIGSALAGYVANLSVWAKAASGTVTVTLTIGATARTVTVPSDAYQRVSMAATLAGGTISPSIGLSGAASVFGAQCVAMPGPGAYAKTPGHAGVFSNCRFDQDELVITYDGPTWRSARVRVQQFAA